MNFVRLVCSFVAVLALGSVMSGQVEAAEWFVVPGGSGSGTSSAPFGRIQDALNAAQPGDTVTLRPGAYAERIRTVRSGTAAKPIRLRGTGQRGSVLVTARGRVLSVGHAYFVVEGLIIDGQYGADDTVRVETRGNYFMLRDAEVRRSTYDLIDVRGPVGVLIENCLIHHALNASGGRTDAHGVAAGPVRDFTLRNTEIHTFSGDGFQVDSDRSAPGWNSVVVDSVRFWLAPLPAPANGFAAGAVPGENAIDTKASGDLPRANLTIRNTTASGFRGGLIGNMAAFNLKENINATLDGVTVFDSEIAFRLRGLGADPGGAWVTLKNAVVHDVLTAYRYEDNVRNLRIWNNTLGKGVTRAFRAEGSASLRPEVRNLLFLGPRAAEAADASNLGVTDTAFVNAGRHDYRLAAGTPAIDSGVRISGVSVDRNGVARPVGAGVDVGAYEWQPPDPGEVATHTYRAITVSGAWRIVADSTAAGGARLSHPDGGSAALSLPRKAPIDYFELTVPVEAGRAYRLWLRGRADGNSPDNDSVFVQFSGAVTLSGSPIYRVGTTSALTVNIEECGGCGLHGWGWQDTGAGVAVLGPLVRFAADGLQTIRIQTREDGISIDQAVLSPLEYLTAAPGSWTDDTVIVEITSGR
jgi:hypothetical protein